MEMKEKELRRRMVEICRESFRQGLFTGTSGNLSVYLEAGEMLITPTSLRYDQMEPEDIVRCDLEGKVLAGARQPSSEWRMHAEVYRACPQHKALFHTHSPYATAFVVVHRSIPAVLIEMQLFLGGEIPCAAYATPGTREVGLHAVTCLQEGAGACLLANHGVLAVGEDLEQARLRAEYVEDAARIYHYAAALGEPVTIDRL